MDAAISESAPPRWLGLLIFGFSSSLFCFSSESLVVISDGNTPGAIWLTLIFASARVVASILVRCTVAALLDAYANWPLLEPFI